MPIGSKPLHLPLIVAALLWTAAAQGQTPHSPYAGEQTRPIKALAERDVLALIEGQGAGYAKAAELNGYPGPMHTLELRHGLSLSAEQVTATEAFMRAHKQRARVLGGEVVEAERRLDALFADRRADAQAVNDATRDIAGIQARMRAEHLNTHLAQTALLSAAQVREYNRLRGYDGTTPPASTEPRTSHPHKPHH